LFHEISFSRSKLTLYCYTLTCPVVAEPNIADLADDQFATGVNKNITATALLSTNPLSVHDWPERDQIGSNQWGQI